MDFSKAKAWVEANGFRIRDAAGLRHWHVKFVLESLRGKERIPGGACLGKCETYPDYNRAVVTIDYDQIDDEAELEKVVVHEVLHILMAPLNVYRDYCNQGVEADSVQASRNGVIWDYFVEQCLINLERLWEHREEYTSTGQPVQEL